MDTEIEPSEEDVMAVADVIKDQTLAGVLRLFILVGTMAIGILGYIIDENVVAMYDRVRSIDDRTVALTAAVSEARISANEAKADVANLKSDFGSKFQSLQDALNRYDKNYSDDHLHLLELQTRIICLERHTSCPIP